MNILVTGANGYLGREVVKWLLTNTAHHIFALSREWKGAPSKQSPRLTKIKFSLNDLKGDYKFRQADQIHLIVHLAGKILFNDNIPDGAISLLDQNCLNLIKVLGWAKYMKVTKFIFISSMSVYASPRKGILQDELHPREPVNFYGLTKLFGEEILKQYGRQTGIRVITLRLPGLFGGERKKGLMYNLAYHIKGKTKINLGLKGLDFWESMGVEDAAAVIGGVIKRNSFRKSYDVFNVGYEDKRMSIRPLISFMEKYYGLSARVNIKNEKMCKPFTMVTKKIRKLLPHYPVCFQRGLERFLAGID